MPINVALIIGLILGLLATIAAMIFITPESRRKSLNKYLAILHDIFNFKFLLIEKILKAVYIFLTISSIVAGFFMLFSGIRVPYTGDFYSFFWYGLVTMIVSPIILRIIFESFMLKIIETRNVIEINKKMKAPAPRRPRPQQDQYAGYSERRQNYDSYQ